MIVFKTARSYLNCWYGFYEMLDYWGLSAWEIRYEWSKYADLGRKPL